MFSSIQLYRKMCFEQSYLLMLWCPFSLLQSNNLTVPSVLALANNDEFDRSAVNLVTDVLCSCKWAISVPLILCPGGIIAARFAASMSVVALNKLYSNFSRLCKTFNSLRQSDVRSAKFSFTVYLLSPNESPNNWCTLNEIFLRHTVFGERSGRCVVYMSASHSACPMIITHWCRWSRGRFLLIAEHSLPLGIHRIVIRLTRRRRTFFLDQCQLLSHFQFIVNGDSAIAGVFVGWRLTQIFVQF